MTFTVDGHASSFSRPRHDPPRPLRSSPDRATLAATPPPWLVTGMEPGDEESEVDLRGYVNVVRRRWKIVAALVALAVVLATLLSVLQEPQFRARGTVLIDTSTAEALVTPDPTVNVNQAERQLNNEVNFLESGTFRSKVAERYDGGLSPARVKARVSSQDADVIDVSVTASDATDAARLVNVALDTFIQVRREARIDELIVASQEIQSKITDIEARIDEIRAPLTEVEQQLVSEPGNASLVAQRAVLEDQLQPRLDPLESQRSFYGQQLEDLRLSAGLARTGNAQILTVATPPSSPVSPQPVRNAALGLLLGLALGIGAAFLFEALDERIRTVSKLEQVVPDLPMLATIPHTPEAQDSAHLAVRDAPGSPNAEAYRSLRTSLKFAALERPIKVVQVTSPGPGEGKTTTTANLAYALAKGGDRVGIICCDLRRPSIHERLGAELEPGLTDVLAGDTTLAKAARKVDENVLLLPAGSHAPNPSELLSSSRTTGVVKLFAEQCDVVLLDTTPTLPVTDALVVSGLADATIVVANSRTTGRTALRRTLTQLRQVGAPLLGVVLNGVPMDGAHGYGYGYGYGYGAESGERGRRLRRRGRSKRSPVTVAAR